MNDVSRNADVTGTDTPNSLDCGVVGNCAFSAMIDRMGRVVWSCLPRFDGDPVFNALLDPSENGSLWSFELENVVRSEQVYEPNTAVLRTRLVDEAGKERQIRREGGREAASHATATVPSSLPPGAYRIEWRAMGGDGHVMSGAVRFAVTSSR